ncbi:MAG: tRNA (adenosine(37)-N6)-threonylcarbamoyltransferase complex dimerization subunit type 1 TsaB [Acidobacteria bacterium]|nr:tRNA (adenosine(37)-N6)-threonylcarbamoyltransferase complex dimerization subunit type 1 TsaB [Acidobacteriota bacterium]
MVILALDTTTRPGSAAVMQDGRVLREAAGDSTREQAVRLPGDLAALLADASLSLSDVSALAVATGPGSFTGLRVGIATMQGLAVAMRVPLIGVSALDALAHMAFAQHPGGRVAAWIDAWRGEVFAACYEAGREVSSPTVAKPHDVATELRDESIRFTGDGALVHQAVIRDTLGSAARFTDPVAPVLAGAIAALAHAAYLAGERPLPHAIQPLYVRRPDVELTGSHRPV